MRNKHAVRNEDESIWVYFSGEVPRNGESVCFIGDKTEYEVYKVLWFIESNDFGSQARVYIRPKESNDEIQN
ncbi:MAG TPA: hypothetical protein VIG33_14710 [Pseudobdellovibrionaceae bacterium]